MTQLPETMGESADEAVDALRDLDLRRILSASERRLTVIDVGANSGQFALALLSNVDCDVYCFEPGRSAFSSLELAASRESRIHPFRYAIDLEVGTQEFFISASDVGSSLLLPLDGQSSKWAQTVSREEVHSIRLDTFFESQSLISIDLLKTDAQGTDGRVLKSAGRYLKPEFINAVLVELNLHAFYKGQDSLSSIIELLNDCGYFLAGFYPHRNRNGWLWWADGLFLPRVEPYAT